MSELKIEIVACACLDTSAAAKAVAATVAAATPSRCALGRRKTCTRHAGTKSQKRGTEPSGARSRPLTRSGVLRAFPGRAFSFSLSAALGHLLYHVLRYPAHKYALVPTAEVVVQQ